MARLSLPVPLLGPADSVEKEYTAEVDLIALQPVYISSDDSVSPAQAHTPSTAKCIGFALADALAGSQVKVRQFGDLEGFSGLVANETMFLSAAVAGQIVTVPPSGAGETIVVLGTCRAPTKLFIDIETVARRAS